MYQRYYNLLEPPFELTPNPRYLFMPPSHREALSNLEYGLAAAKSLTVLIGEAGTGKTTLLCAALESERCRNTTCVYVNNPTLTRDEFINTLASRFSLGSEASQSKAFLLEGLERVLRERRSRGEIVALVIDEAQRLSIELLEEVRLLGNIETPNEKLLPLVLAGQPELGRRLEDPALRQLKQRVALRCEIAPFTLPETAAYIGTRIKAAGGVPSQLFTQEAVRLIHERSGGIPRTISVICDNSLVNGMALNRQPVDCALVAEVCRDLHFEPNNAILPPTRAVRPEADPARSAPGAGDTAQPDVRPDGNSARTPQVASRKGRRFSMFA